MISNKRIKWIDISKGIAIIFVVIQHIITAYIRRTGGLYTFKNPLFTLTSTIDIPTFFFLSGLFLDHLFRKPFKSIIKERFTRLMLPYFIWGIISVLFLSIYMKNFQFFRIIELPFKPIFVLWFVYSLFIIDICLYLLHKCVHSNILLLFCLFILYIIGTYLSLKYKIQVDSSLKLIFGTFQGLFFVYLGYLYKTFMSLKRNMGCKNYIIASIILFLVLIVVVHIHLLILNYFVPILGIILMIFISKCLVNNILLRNFLSYIGFITMQIYVMHKFIVELFSLIVIKLTNIPLIFLFIELLLTIITCGIFSYIFRRSYLYKIIFGIK